MIFAVSLALTTLFITLNSISLPYNAVSSLASCLNLITSASDPVNPFPTLTRPFAPHATVSAVPSDIHTYNRGASEQPYNVIPHSVSVAPSETVMHIVPDPELCISISPSALDCLFFVTLSFAILSYCLLTTSSSKHGPVADVPASLTESHVIDKPERSYEGYREGSTESDAPLKEKRETFEREEPRVSPGASSFQQIVPPGIEFDISDVGAPKSWAWKAPRGHFTIIYTPDMPDDHPSSKELQLDVRAGEYIFTIQRARLDNSPVEAAIVENAHAASASTEATSGVQTDAIIFPSVVVDIIPSPGVISSRSVPANLGSHDLSLFPSLLGSTQSEQDMKTLLASMPMSPDDYIISPPVMSTLNADHAPVSTAPESDEFEPWDVFSAPELSFTLHASASLLTSKPMDEIEEEMTRILAPRAGPSTGCSPLPSRPFISTASSFVLHTSPSISLITSTPMDGIEEEITSSIAPFSCAGSSTGFSPLPPRSPVSASSFVLHASPSASLLTSVSMDEIDEEMTRSVAPFSRVGPTTGFSPLPPRSFVSRAQ